MKRWWGWSISGLTLVAALSVSLVWAWLRSSLPEDPPELDAKVEQAVAIHYDQRRRPYVRAQSWADAYHAQGWLHARERLWQMELFRRAGRGRLAEVLGPGMLDTDTELIRAGVPVLAQRLAANASATQRAFVDAYVQGINAALAELSALPPEFVLADFSPLPWQPEDVFALGALMAFQSGNNFRNELLRLAIVQGVQQHLGAVGGAELARWTQVLAPIDQDLQDFPYVVPTTQVQRVLARLDSIDVERRPLLSAPGLGSNGWVVSPARSDSGYALFAFDSHDSFSMPNLTYEVHLFVGDEQVRGSSVPGLLGVINGFNEFMAWGFTNTGDSQDLFVETQHAEHVYRFLGRAGWYDAKVVQVEVPIAGRASETIDVVHTENGRLLSSSPPLSLRWSALAAPNASLDALRKLNRAVSYAGFTAALDDFAAPSANATYADITGRIAFRSVGVLPVRGAGMGLLPQAGEAADSAWRGMIPTAELPRLIDPQEGFVAAANARVNAGVPLISADNAPGYRIQRIRQVLGAKRSHTVTDMQRLQVDWYNAQAGRVLPAMLAAVERSQLTDTEQHVLERLSKWSREPVNVGDAAEPLWFEAWYRTLASAAFEPILGQNLTQRLLGASYVVNHALDRLLLLAPNAPWWQGRKQSLITQALQAGLAGVPEADTWQQHHGVWLRHELSAAVPQLGALLDSGPHPWGGGNATVGRARYDYRRPYTARGGATARLVIEMSTPMRAYSISPGGQSGHLLSDHYDDQTAAWLAGQLDSLAMRPEALGSPTTVLHP